ncbi:MAG TPA: MarR family transcriptional regulator [Actinomycetota bacterium]|nr:MarR family transcriptional regulator [Actinomycetota bacterium]
MAQAVMSRMLFDASRALDVELAEALEDRGATELTPTQARALLLVDRAGTRLTELATRAGVTKQAMMQLVDELQASGCVRRTPDPADARAKVVRLTARGLRQRALARQAVASVEARVKRWLGLRRYEAFRAILEELVEGEEE